jgi:hypothetical protein
MADPAPAARLARIVGAREPAQKIPASAQRKADAEHELVAEAAVIHMAAMFSICSDGSDRRSRVGLSRRWLGGIDE